MNRTVKISIWLLIAFVGNCMSNIAIGQANNSGIKNSFFVEPIFQAGKILDIYPDFPERGAAFFTGVNFSWQTVGKNWWNSYYKFPQTGILLLYGSLGDKDVLGSNISIVPNISFKLVRKNRFSLEALLGMGFAWFNKPYDIVDNPENIVIGSHISNVTILSFNGIYSVSRKFEIVLGVSAQHYSNGHIQIPNVGANIPVANIGLKYFPGGSPDKYFSPDSILHFDKKLKFVFRMGMGVHEFASPTIPVGGPKYPVYVASAYLSKRLSVITNIIFGLQGNYYTSYFDFITSNNFYSDNQHQKSIRLIAFGGVEMIMGRFGFLLQLGLNVYNPFYKDLQRLNENTSGFKNFTKSLVSSKLGAQYYILNPVKTTKLKPFVGLFLNGNAGQADLFEVSLGCGF